MTNPSISQSVGGLLAVTALALSTLSISAHAAERANTPTDVVPLFAKHFNAGDLEGVMSLYQANSIFVPAPGSPVTTPEAVRGAIAQFLATKVPINITTRHVYQTKDTALMIADWSMKGIAADGKPMDLSGTATDIVRKGADGGWHYLIDNPFGGLRP